MNKLLVMGFAALLSACGGSGSNSGNNAAANTSKLSFSSSASSVAQNQVVILSWIGEAVENCQASGAWNGAKDSSGRETVALAQLGKQLFSLSCDVENASSSISKSLTVLVVANDSPKSGVDGDDADALFEHFNQYAQ